MSDQRRYARAYHDLRTDLYEVYSDGALLGTYLQLLIEADISFPEPGQVPREVDDAQFERLLEFGEVLVGPRPHTFRMKRLDFDRLSEAKRQRNNANRRWKTDPPEPEHLRRIRSYYRRNATALPQTDEQTVTDKVSETAPLEGASRLSVENGEPKHIGSLLGSYEEFLEAGKR